MKIIVSGTPDHDINKAELKEAVKFYLTELIKDPNIFEGLYVRIKFEKDLDVAGFCDWTDAPIGPERFDILLNCELKRIAILKTLAHESVHIKQMATGELYQNFAKYKMMKWRGKNVKFADAGSRDYYYSPWEIEAHGLQDFLYNEYMVFRDLRRRGQSYDPNF
jgi:hypothetical protein